MLVSVFTPSHDPRFLDDCYRSLAAQSLTDWEWVVLLNNEAAEWRPPEPDDRVKVHRAGPLPGVGAAKREACARCVGEILVELDHDDVLARGCLSAIYEAFTSTAVPDPGGAAQAQPVLVYSDWAQANEDLSRNDDRFAERWGWVYSETDVGGSTYLRCHAMAAYPHNVAYIWYAPNHVRAFSRSAYEQVGGYDSELQVLDDQELMTRLFLSGEFVHLDECLYLQRIHPSNTQSEPETNAYIQAETVRCYQRNIAAMAAAWSRRRGLSVLSLRSSTSPPIVDDDPGDIVVIDPLKPLLDLADDSVGVIKAFELLQRVHDRTLLFNECHRVLVHGGLVLTQTPSTDGRGAFQDPSHVSYWNENSFWYLTEAARRSSVPDLTARLQVSHLRTYFPSAWHEENQIPYVQANLLAVKEGARLGGALLC